MTQLVSSNLTTLAVWIAALSSAEGAAFAGAALRLTNLVAFPLQATNAVLPNMIGSLDPRGRRGRVAIERLARSSTTLIAIGAVPFLLLVIVLPRQMMTLVFGATYEKGALFLAMAAAAQLVNVFTGSCGTVLLHLGGGKTVASVALASGVFTSLIGVAGMWLGMGPISGILAYLCGTAFGNAAMWHRLRSGYHVKVHPYGLRSGARAWRLFQRGI